MKEQEKEVSFRDFFTPLTNTKIIHFLSIIGILIFANGLFNTFLADDLSQIVTNTLLHSPTNIPLYFTGNKFYNGGDLQTIGTFYRPFILTFFTLLYSTFGESPFAFHFFQLPIVIANAVFIFLLFSHFLKKHLAFILSLIFLVHPINSDIAFYVADVEDALFFFFGILALFILVKTHSQKKLFALPVLFLFSLFCKETGILFIVISLLYAGVFKRKFFSFVFWSSGTTLFIYAVLRLSAIGAYVKPTSSPISHLTLLERITNIPALFYFYIKTFFNPVPLSMIYQWAYKTIDLEHFFIPLFFDVLFLGFFSAFLFIFYKNKKMEDFKLYLFFFLWFLLGISMHMQLIPLDATVANRWFYVPMVGLLGMIGILINYVHVNVKNTFFLSLIILLILFLSIRTFMRSFDWRDAFTLASHDITVSPDSYSLESQLSYSYYNHGDLKKAKLHAEKSIAIYPAIINYYNLGAVNFALKDYKGAKEAFIHATEIGNDAQTYESLAFLFLLYGNPKENISFLENKALKKFPQDGKLWLRLAILEYNFTNKEKAKEDITKAYSLLQTQEVMNVYNAIMNNKPVVIEKRK